MQALYSYINYRTFLKDYYEEKKRLNPNFSYRVFSRLCGFNSPNFLKLIMMAERNLSDDGITKVTRAIKLRAREAEYFTTLVHFNQTEDREKKAACFESLRNFKAFKEIKQIEHESYEYLNKWHHVAIRELVILKNFKEDPAWIAKKLKNKITEAEVKDSIKLLLNLGLLKRDATKRLIQSEKNLTTETEVMDLSVANFHDTMIALAAESIDNSRPSERDISSVTVALNKETFLEAKRRIQEFRRELNILLSNCKTPDAVYQMNFQIFNLSEVKWEDEDL